MLNDLSVADKILCMPIHSLHHIVYIFTLYIISISESCRHKDGELCIFLFLYLYVEL